MIAPCVHFYLAMPKSLRGSPNTYKLAKKGMLHSIADADQYIGIPEFLSTSQRISNGIVVQGC